MKMCATSSICRCWEDIDFKLAEKNVKKLQRRIADAHHNGKPKVVSVLQHKLTHSFYAKALAIKIVTTRKGKYTPGVDGIVWATSRDKFNAIFELNRREYKPEPLRRIYISKSGGKKRPLSIPTMRDRAMQMLYKFALDPIAEDAADKNSYGFRIGRGAKDAVLKCIKELSDPYNAFVLKADIKSCFDNISHEWLLQNIPMDKFILRRILKCGYISNNIYHPTTKGIPQGGCLSTTVCNLTLDGLEELIKKNAKSSVSYIRFADDIIVIGAWGFELTNTVKPLINDFLLQRGLRLSPEKTKFSLVNDGFTFLGCEIKRNYKTVEVLPTQKNIDSLNKRVDEIIDEYKMDSTTCFEKLIRVIGGWCSYYKDIVPDSVLYKWVEVSSKLPFFGASHGLCGNVKIILKSNKRR